MVLFDILHGSDTIVTTSPPGRFKIANLVAIPMNNIIQYLKDTRAEMSHVSWPTQKQTIIYTIMVIAVSFFVAFFVGFFDFLFSKALSFIVGN